MPGRYPGQTLRLRQLEGSASLNATMALAGIGATSRQQETEKRPLIHAVRIGLPRVLPPPPRPFVRTTAGFRYRRSASSIVIRLTEHAAAVPLSAPRADVPPISY